MARFVDHCPKQVARKSAIVVVDPRGVAGVAQGLFEFNAMEAIRDQGLSLCVHVESVGNTMSYGRDVSRKKTTNGAHTVKVSGMRE